jgi:cytochrome P450
VTRTGSAALVAETLLDPRSIEDPYPLYARLRREAPVAEIAGTQTFFVSTWDLVEQAVGRDDDFSANLTGFLYTGADGRPDVFALGEIAGSAGAVIATADEPDHALHRALLQPAMTASQVANLEPWIRSQVAERTDALVRKGGGDYAARVAEPVPTRAMARLLDLPEADCERLQVWAMTGGDMLAGTTTPARMAELGVQTGAMAAYLGERIRSGGGSPGLIGVLARAVESRALDAGAAVGIAIVLVGAGGESTASLVGNAVRLLAERPALQAELRAQPERIPRFVEETLRLESPFQFHYRVVRRDCRLGEVALSRGARIMLGWASANRDETAFERADQVDLARRFPKRHLGFGRGPHFCLGAPLARLEARIAVEELLARTTRIALVPKRPPRHWPSLFVRRLAELPIELRA